MRTKFVIFLFIGIAILSACSSNGNKMFDEKHKTIYINGVSAIEGKNAVIESLINSGFKLDDFPDTLENFYPKIGRFVNDHPNKKQFDLIFWNILDGLEYDTSEIAIILSWYENGTIASCFMSAGPIRKEIPQKSIAEIRKRVAERFEHSKSADSLGNRIYYNNEEVKFHYPNDNTFLIQFYDEETPY